jgi:hypothetical protein
VQVRLQLVKEKEKRKLSIQQLPTWWQKSAN